MVNGLYRTIWMLTIPSYTHAVLEMELLMVAAREAAPFCGSDRQVGLHEVVEADGACAPEVGTPQSMFTFRLRSPVLKSER